MICYNVDMSKYTGLPTIRYIAYKDEFQLKDDKENIRIPNKLFLTTLENKGWPPYYHVQATTLKYFCDTYVVTKTLAKRLKMAHRKENTRIIILAKRK